MHKMQIFSPMLLLYVRLKLLEAMVRRKCMPGFITACHTVTQKSN